MAIIDLQRRISERGRIRIGQKVVSNGKTRPAKLETFRLTSADRRVIEQAAELYGGKVAEWEAPAGKQWEVITGTDVLDIVIPPSDLSFSQHLELWSAGGCQRRCDGRTESLSQGPCLCDPDPDKRECDYHTRLSVLLRDLPGLGVWRLDTSGYYAANELGGAVELIAAVAGRGALLPARLRLEQRSTKRPDGKGKVQTLRYAVPVIDIEISPGQLLAAAPTETLPMATGLAGDRPAFTPVPQLTGPVPSIAEQSQPPAERPKRANAAAPIPASGRTRAAAANQAPEQEPVATPVPAIPPAQPDEPIDDLPPLPPAAPAARQARPRAAGAKKPGDEGYWRARTFAEAAERSLEQDDVRIIAAALTATPADQIADFSMSDLSEELWKALHTLITRLPKDLDTDKATLWLFPLCERKGLTDWEQIDLLATAAMNKAPDEASVAEWIAFGLRVHAGEYDQPEQQAE